MASRRDFKKVVNYILDEHRTYCILAAHLVKDGSFDKSYEFALQVYNDSIEQVTKLLANISKEDKNKRAFYRSLHEQINKICSENEAKISKQFQLD